MRLQYNKNMRLVKTTVSAFAILGLVLTSLPAQPASALSGSDWNAANIISDGVFYDGGDMSLYDVQAFLNSKVPACDTMGNQQYSPGVTRAQYGASRGYPTPYVCLKDFVQEVPERPAEPGLCNGISVGTRTAARIIYDVALSCGINLNAEL